MIDLSDIYVSLLSGLTTKKNDKEIWWKLYNVECTIEIIDADTCSYIYRRYNHDGSLYERAEYVNDKPHGSHMRYNKHGKVIINANYCNGNLVAGWWDK